MAVEIKIGVVPGKIEMIAVNEGTTIREALAAANITVDTQGYTITMNSADATLDTRINSNTSVLLTKKIKGNQ